MEARCTACGAALELPCACKACGALQPLATERDPWTELGFEPGFDLDEALLKKRLFSSLFSTPILAKRSAMTNGGSSAARMPLPDATIALKKLLDIMCTLPKCNKMT